MQKERERKDMSNLVTPINVMKLKKDDRKNSKLAEQKRSRSGSISHQPVKQIQLSELITFNVISTGSSGTTKKNVARLHFEFLGLERDSTVDQGGTPKTPWLS